MVRNKLYWDANNAVGLPKQRNSYQLWSLILCVPTENILRTLERRCNKFGVHVTFFVLNKYFELCCLELVAELVREGRDGGSIS